MYKVVFLPNNISEYYNDDNLLFIVKRKVSFFGLTCTCHMYDEDVLICHFQATDFTILYWKINILIQKFEKKILLKKVGFRYKLIVNEECIYIKFTDNPFKKIIGKIFLNEDCIGEIEKNEKNSKTYFNFNFYEKSRLEYYVLILFSMCSVGITDSV